MINIGVATQSFEFEKAEKMECDYDKYGVTLSEYTDYPPPRYENTFQHHGKFFWNWESYIADFDWHNEVSLYPNSMQSKVEDPNLWDMLVHDLNTLDDDLFKHCQYWWKEYFGTSRIDVAIIKNNIGSISSLHKDNFHGCRIRRGWKEKIPDEIVYSHMTKYWIPLQDRKPGHFFECDGICLSEWKQGDIWTFANERAHLGATVGVEPRYFMSINTIRDDVWDSLP